MSAIAQRPELSDPQCLIGAEWQAGGGDVMPVHDPSTGDVLCELRFATPDAVDAAVRAARAAQPAWGATPATERARVLMRIARALGDRVQEIAPVITADNG